VLAYSLFGYDVAANLLLAALIICIAFEWCRLRNNTLGQLCRLMLDKLHITEIMRQDELTNFTSATKLIFIAYIMLYAMQKNLYLAAFSVLMISDPLAALVGSRCGKLKLYGKSIEGSVAFLLSATVISFIWWLALGETYTYLFIALMSAGLAAILELCSNKINIDDNMLIPSAYAILGWLYQAILSTPKVAPW